jgi:hypothetical protein
MGMGLYQRCRSGYSFFSRDQRGISGFRDRRSGWASPFDLAGAPIIDKLALLLLALPVRLVGISFDLPVVVELKMPIFLAQCVMCFRTASAQQLERARVLDDAILLLGIPPLCILAAFTYLAFRRR